MDACRRGKVAPRVSTNVGCSRHWSSWPSLKHSYILKCNCRAKEMQSTRRDAVERELVLLKLTVDRAELRSEMHVSREGNSKHAKEMLWRGRWYGSSCLWLKQCYVLKCMCRASKRSAVDIAFHKHHVMRFAKRCCGEGTGTAQAACGLSSAFIRQYLRFGGWR